jgi:hypothetical protein
MSLEDAWATMAPEVAIWAYDKPGEVIVGVKHGGWVGTRAGVFRGYLGHLLFSAGWSPPQLTHFIF